MFQLNHITKHFGSEMVLNDISMSIGNGLNFIIGASGSGKTTLLKILSGMDKDFEGDAAFNQKNIKELSSKELSEYYAHEFGFVWQDFNLIEDLTAYENIEIPLYLTKEQSAPVINKVMRQLKISEFSKMKVKNLSGGQKQRVAIARELVKNPQVILADEPTASLDPKSSGLIMDLLKQIAKTKTVIIVTHDTSFIDKKSNVFELDKGELISVIQQTSARNTQTEEYKNKAKQSNPHSFFHLKSAISLSKNNLKNRIGRSVLLAAAIVVSSTFLLLNSGGSIQNKSQQIFDELIATYGDNVFDIQLVNSFMSAAGSGGGDNDEPNADVNQDITGFYEKYMTDPRVNHIVFTQAFDDIEVSVDEQNYPVDGTGNSPVLNKLTAGRFPTGDEYEVVVPQGFVKNLGISEKDILGKQVIFRSNVYNWESGEPVKMPVEINVTIVGVADNSVTYESGGKVFTSDVSDSFFFSRSAVEDLRTQADTNPDKVNMSIRANSPSDMIQIKDELNEAGIVPLGRFELVEDIVRLNKQSSNQSDSAYLLIGILAVAAAFFIALLTAALRKKEYAIYQINGYTKFALIKLTAMEYLLTAVLSFLLFIVLSPIINLILKASFDFSILNLRSYGNSGVIILCISILCSFTAIAVFSNVKTSKCMQSGDR